MSGRALLSLVVMVISGLGHWCAAADQPQWGQRHTRNMVSSETGLPESWNPETGENICWTAPLGEHGYSTPVISQGRVLIGASNDEPRDPRHQGDRAVLLCLDEADGHMHWQLVVPRLENDIYLDWPNISLCSPPTVEGDRVYVVSNRAEVMCLDLHGQENGNDGPYLDEAVHMTPQGESPLGVTPHDADIVWLFDMREEVGVYPHDAAHASILIDGPYLYLNTGNGVDNTHRKIRAPQAPSMIVVDKRTGKLAARDEEGIGPRIFHSTWSSPALAQVQGERRIFFCGGDGVVYAFPALDPQSPPGPPRKLERIFRFDCDPDAPKENLNDYKRNKKVSPSNIKSMPVFCEDRLYVTVGGDIWWGKEEAWLQCIDATQRSEVTRTALVWSCPLQRHCCSTPAIYQGMAFVGDLGKFITCVDTQTGQPLWQHETDGEIWGSPLVADGKVYLGSRRGDCYVFRAAREKQLLARIPMGDPVNSSAVAANGRLYIATLTTLFAIER